MVWVARQCPPLPGYVSSVLADISHVHRWESIESLTPGVLHLFYAVWDYCDEQFWGKPNPSDCVEMAILAGWTPGSEYNLDC